MTIIECINQFKEQLNIDSFSEDQCIGMLKTMDDAYENDPTLLENNGWDDTTYNLLRQMVQIEYSDNNYFQTIGSSVRTGSNIPLPYKMGSLNEVFTQQDIDDWVKTYNLDNEIIVITPKFDGNSCETLYEHVFQQSFSRGNGFEGADTTRHMKHVLSKYNINLRNIRKQTNDTGVLALRGEVIWKNSEFDNFSHLNYKHPRNAVAGFMNAEVTDVNILHSVSYIPFSIDSCSAQLDKLTQLSILHNNGFEPYEVFTCLGKDLNVEFLTKTILELRSKMDYKIDGIVIEINDNSIRQRIQPNNTNPNPEYAIKFKVDQLPVTAVVDHIEWNISKAGYYKPTIIYQPVDIDGITCTRATGYNARYILMNQIGPGSLIKIVRRGDVVPNCVGIIKSTTAQLPENLQDLEWTINSKGEQVDLFSPIPTTESKILQMVYCAEKLQVPFLGEGNIRQLHNTFGILETHELLKLKKESFINCIGSNGEKIYDGLMERLSNVDECVLAAASGVFGRGIGERKLKNILSQTKCSIDALTPFKLCVLDGVGDKTIDAIVNKLDEYKQWLKEIEGYVNIIPSVSSEVKKFDELKIVFTGFRDNDLQWYLEKNGATIQSAVSKHTNIVITPDPTSNSSKIKKCRELIAKGIDIKIISVEDFKQQYVLQVK